MSSPNQATSETALLLGDSLPLVSQSCGSPSRERSRISPETLLIPVALATRLAALISSTTLIELIRRAACRLWNTLHGNPASLPVGNLNSELCDAPEIARYFSIAIAALTAIECILSIVGCGILGRISSRHGRKPAFLLVLIAGTLGHMMIAGSQYMPDWLSDWIFLAGTLLDLFSNPIPYAYLVNMYVVDVCGPEDRTAALSRIVGWTMLGTCVSFALGGFVTTKTRDPAIVFYMAAAIFMVTFIYVFSFLPESFPEDKRNALSRMRSEPAIDGLPAAALFASSWHIFEPLKTLIPSRKQDGSRNWRLAWCAAHTFMFAAANAYAASAWLILVTSKYHLNPAQTGLFLTIVSVSGTIILTVLVPPLVRVLRPYYLRKTIPSILVEEEITNGMGPESLRASDRLDVHLGFISCVAAAFFYLSAAASTTELPLIISGICIGFVSVHTPTLRSLVAGSVDPLKQGEALTAIEIVSNTGSFLSTIIMGSILTATIGTRPLLVFYVHLVVVLMSSALLLLVRDADGYQKTHDA